MLRSDDVKDDLAHLRISNTLDLANKLDGAPYTTHQMSRIIFHTIRSERGFGLSKPLAGLGWVINVQCCELLNSL